MARVAIVTNGHFCTSPRVWREADALAAAGFEVAVIGVSFDPRQAALDREMAAGRAWRHHVAEDLTGGGLRWVWRRAQTRAARTVLDAGLELPHALTYAAPSLLRAARAEAADLTIVHLEAGLWVGTRLLTAGARVGVDIEDWHSENDAGAGWDTRRERACLARLERTVLRGAAHATTTSDALAAALAAAYGVPPPLTLYNSCPTRPLVPAHPAKALRFVWFSQTLGPGRGIEHLCAALPQVAGDWEVELRARASDQARRWLHGLLPAALRTRVRVEPLVPPDQLPTVVGGHDVGLALESRDWKSRDLTVTNKICEYLQCGLRVVASDTAGQREILARVPAGGDVYTAGDVSELAAVLSGVVARRDAIRADRARLHGVANQVLAYEHQAQRLVASVHAAIRSEREGQA